MNCGFLAATRAIAVQIPKGYRQNNVGVVESARFTRRSGKALPPICERERILFGRRSRCEESLDGSMSVGT
jgi:hypothetical protein